MIELEVKIWFENNKTWLCSLGQIKDSPFPPPQEKEHIVIINIILQWTETIEYLKVISVSPRIITTRESG